MFEDKSKEILTNNYNHNSNKNIYYNESVNDNENDNDNVEYKDIFNNLNVQNWFKMIAIEEPLAFSIIIGDNRKNFKKIYGQPTGNENGRLFWKIADQGLMFIVSSDNYKSFYLVKHFGSNENFENNIKTGAYLINFMQNLLDKLSR